MGRTEGRAHEGDPASPGRSGRQAGEHERRLNEREHQTDERERAADEREQRLDERGAQLKQQAVMLRAEAASITERAVQAVAQAETALEAAQDRVRRTEGTLNRAKARAARERASAARSARRGEQHPDPQHHDFTDLADRVSALRKRTAAAAAHLAETEEQAARVHDELASRDPRNPEYKRQANEAREVMRQARETERKYSSS